MSPRCASRCVLRRRRVHGTVEDIPTLVQPSCVIVEDRLSLERTTTRLTLHTAFIIDA